jgi:hypothetical protein
MQQMNKNRPDISVVIPTFNSEKSIEITLKYLEEALLAADTNAQIIVIDKSDDLTRERVLSFADTFKQGTVEIHRQQGNGRFLARSEGLSFVKNEVVLLIDSRVFIDRYSLNHVLNHFDLEPNQCWGAHVRAQTSGNLIAGVWQAIEHVAWRKYFKNPRHVQFGISDFDHFPKGTTAAIASRTILLEAVNDFEVRLRPEISADDNQLLRLIAQRWGINISPEYSALYNARTTLRQLVQHGFQKGSTFCDGNLRFGSRFFAVLVVFLISTPLGISLLVLEPIWAATSLIGLTLLVGPTSTVFGSRPSDSFSLALFFIPLSISYGLGIWRWVILKIWSLARSTLTIKRN